MQNGDGLIFIINSSNDAKRTPLHVEHHAQSCLGGPGVRLFYISPFLPISCFNGLQPTIEMAFSRPTFTAKSLNMLPADYPHDRNTIPTRETLTNDSDVYIITYC